MIQTQNHTPLPLYCKSKQLSSSVQNEEDLPEGDEDDEDGFLMDMPTEHEGAISTEDQTPQEAAGTRRVTPQMNQSRLKAQATYHQRQVKKNHEIMTKVNNL